MDPVTQIAERRIAEALERGELDNLPGAGEPLVLDDDRDVPAELRVAYRVLKNAGFVPPEVELRREIASVETLVRCAGGDDEGHARALRRLSWLRLRLAESRHGGRVLALDYEARILERFSDGS